MERKLVSKTEKSIYNDGYWRKFTIAYDSNDNLISKYEENSGGF